ncbi:MAG TPA: hypothetical protein VE776_06410 [Actinomycetota bacterium]|nr:hypothetical protein [Actinomycetota bacterium]
MTTPGTAASGSALISALERTWATIRQRHPELPDVVFVTGTGLRYVASAGARAKWGRFGAERWVQGHPQPPATTTTEAGHDAKLDLRANRKPELFVAGECFAEGAEHTLTTILHEAAHALAHVRQVHDTSRQGKYHNRRFAQLAGELGLAWPVGVRAHPVSGFSEVRLAGPARTAYADTIADLEAAITLHLDTFQRLRLAGIGRASSGTDPATGNRGAEGTGGKTFNRVKLVCACSPQRSIRISPKQAARGPIVCGACGKQFRPEDQQD